jgi:hypothetical protein
MSTLTTKPFQIYLREGQLEALRALAHKRGQSIAELVRQGIDQLLLTVSAEENPLFDIIGIGDSGLGDLSVNHDQYLAEFELEDNRKWLEKSS